MSTRTHEEKIMHLRTIVPTLGLATAAIGCASAFEVGNVTVGGYVDAIASVVDNTGYADVDPDVNFAGYHQLQVGALIGDRAKAQVDVEFDVDSDVTNVGLQQAYVAFQATDMVTLQLGKWEGLIGYEAWDATGLYRVNTSPVFDLNGVLVEGLNVNIAANEELTIDLYIADGVYSDEQVQSDAVGLGANLTYATETYTFDVDLGMDMAATGTADENDPLIGINLSGDYSGVDKLTVFGDFAYRAYEAFNQMGVMVGGNYQFVENASGTLMISYVEQNDEVDDDEIMEVAVAVLTTPTGNENFGINYELEYNTIATDGAEDQVGAFVEFLAVIP